MLKISILALLLTLTVACPYLEREQRNLKEHQQQPSSNNLRHAQAVTAGIPGVGLYSVLNRPTSIAGAVTIATRQIVALLATDGMIAKFVRLSFHDCVGGCDGCVDLANPSNFGLELPIDTLSPVVEHNKKFLTTGDVWALAGLVANRRAQEGTSFTFPLQYVGRPQCAGNATKAGPHRAMPSSHFTTQQVVDFFNKTFQFTAKETVAIMGVHTLGKATSENSGFGGDGGWGPAPHLLTNNYYTELLNFGQFELDFEENAAFPPFPDQFYWEQEVEEGAPAGTFMLHADMALAFDMKGYLNPMNGDVNCTLVKHAGQKLCPKSPLLSQTRAYAANNFQWVKDFRVAYLKMVTSGCGKNACKAIGM